MERDRITGESGEVILYWVCVNIIYISLLPPLDLCAFNFIGKGSAKLLCRFSNLKLSLL